MSEYSQIVQNKRFKTNVFNEQIHEKTDFFSTIDRVISDLVFDSLNIECDLDR